MMVINPAMKSAILVSPMFWKISISVYKENMSVYDICYTDTYIEAILPHEQS